MTTVGESKIPTQAYLKSILSYDSETGEFTWLVNRDRCGNARIGMRAGYLRSSDGYRQIKIKNRGYGEHRLAWLYVNGVWPELLDHADRDKANNRISNLRIATNSENRLNTGISSRNTSGYRGVVWSKSSKKWQAQTSVRGKRVHLGLFESPSLAFEAYQSFVLAEHGAFAPSVELCRAEARP